MARTIDSIVIHCSDSPDEYSFKASDIERWHMERAAKEPWDSFKDVNGKMGYIGYHYVISREGEIQEGRPVEIKGCHTSGFNNESIGVCWIGKKLMTVKQRESLVQCLAELCVAHGLATIDIYEHCQFNRKKTCPNFGSKFTFESIDHLRTAVNLKIAEIK